MARGPQEVQSVCSAQSPSDQLQTGSCVALMVTRSSMKEDNVLPTDLPAARPGRGSKT